MSKRVRDVGGGAVFPVEEVAGREPEELGDFVGATTVTVGDDGRAITVVGIGVIDQGVVRFQEREVSSSATDGAVWRIIDHDGEFEAEPRLEG